MKNGVGTGVNVIAGASTTTRETTERVTNIVFMHARLSEGLANWQEHDAALCHRRFLHVSALARHLRHYFLFSPSSGAQMGSAPFALFPRVIRPPVFGRAYSAAPTLFHADLYGILRKLEGEGPK